MFLKKVTKKSPRLEPTIPLLDVIMPRAHNSLLVIFPFKEPLHCELGAFLPHPRHLCCIGDRAPACKPVCRTIKKPCTTASESQPQGQGSLAGGGARNSGRTELCSLCGGGETGKELPLASKMGNLVSEGPYKNIFQGAAPKKKKMGLSHTIWDPGWENSRGFKRQWSFTQPFRKSGLSSVIWSGPWEWKSHDRATKLSRSKTRGVCDMYQNKGSSNSPLPLSVQRQSTW